MRLEAIRPIGEVAFAASGQVYQDREQSSIRPLMVEQPKNNMAKSPEEQPQRKRYVEAYRPPALQVVNDPCSRDPRKFLMSHPTTDRPLPCCLVWNYGSDRARIIQVYKTVETV
jgi:hypothetical protein